MSQQITIKSAIIRSEKPNKGLDAELAPNPNQMNRITGFLSDGTKAIIAQRPGKGGMDFNKIVGGKVFAVAADGLSPVFEKDKEGKATKTIKTEKGLPLYSSSGFYLLSSKEYPALDMGHYHTRLLNKGEHLLLLTDAQLKQAQAVSLDSDLDLDLLEETVVDLLADEYNLFARFDADVNKRRNRVVTTARAEAEDAGEDYTGVEFKELKVAPKDGAPFVLFAWREGDTVHEAHVVRLTEGPNDDGLIVTKSFDAREAWTHFQATPAYAQLSAAIDLQGSVELMVAQGHQCRTSVSFRRKAENVFAAPPEKTQYGDAVYIQGALQHWCPALVAFLHSMHPSFPTVDYDSHHYVATARQAEITMEKTGDRWTPPKAARSPVPEQLLKKHPA